MKKITIIILGMIVLEACWAPRCPISRCRVKEEHQHEDLISGVFSSRVIPYPPRIHTPFELKKGEKAPDRAFTPNGQKKQKLRKKFPWEKW